MHITYSERLKIEKSDTLREPLNNRCISGQYQGAFLYLQVQRGGWQFSGDRNVPDIGEARKIMARTELLWALPSPLWRAIMERPKNLCPHSKYSLSVVFLCKATPYLYCEPVLRRRDRCRSECLIREFVSRGSSQPSSTLWSPIPTPMQKPDCGSHGPMHGSNPRNYYG
jgi:hypothetical protein